MKDRKSSGRIRSDVNALATRGLVDSRRLLYFYHVARLGSFSQAEAYLDVAQPAITRQVQQFEADLGVELLRRNGRGVALTAAGQVAFAHAEKLMADMAEMRLQVDAASLEPQKSVSIAASTTFMTLFMPEAVRKFVSEYPAVRLQAHEGSSGRVYDMLIAGEVDMAVVLHAAHSQKLKMQKLTSDPLVVLASAKHPAAGKKSLTAEELREMNLVLPASPHGSRAVIESYLGAAGVRVSPTLELDSLALTISVIRNPDLCTILPVVACRSYASTGEFAMVPLSPPLSRTVYLAHLRDKPLTGPAKALANAISAAVADSAKSSRKRRPRTSASS